MFTRDYILVLLLSRDFSGVIIFFSWCFFLVFSCCLCLLVWLFSPDVFFVCFYGVAAFSRTVSGECLFLVCFVFSCFVLFLVLCLFRCFLVVLMFLLSRDVCSGVVGFSCFCLFWCVCVLRFFSGVFDVSRCF